MKNNILHIVITLAIAISTSNAYADGTEGQKENNSSKEKAEKVVDKVKSVLDIELELENWMVNTSEFSSNEIFYEEELIMEDWMIEPVGFNNEMSPIDQEMELEGWMTKSFEITEIEMDMDLQDWMLKPFSMNDNFQEEKLVLEDWMLKF